MASLHFGSCLAHLQSFGIDTFCKDAMKAPYAKETLEYETYLAMSCS
jgi:disulfide oxidoreductase YuzD